MDKHLIKEEKNYTEELLNLNETEEHIIRKKAKVDWIRLGKGNNVFVHASLKSKHKKKIICKLCKEDGTELTNQEDIEKEVLEFIGKLMGIVDEGLEGIGIKAMRAKKQLDSEQKSMLSSLVTEPEVESTLKSLGDLKALGANGFGAKFFNHSFILGKNIHDHVLVASEIIRGYRRKSGMPICML